MDAIQKELLEQVAGLHEIPTGAYNIRANGTSAGRNCTEHIEIITKEDKNGILVDATKCSLKATSLTTSEYPGFPTDAQAPLSMLLSLAPGMSLIEERIFENRFMHIPELKRMGANITVLNNNAILITGVKNLSGAQVMSSDLRGGVSLVLAALAAKGESIVKRIYHIDRGYYQLEKKLTKLGAKIKRIKSKN